jgi:hypothetical protein
VALLHALEEAGLRLRGGAVHLVDQHDVREHRAGPELEAVLALVVDVRADHVGRQKVGRALDPGVLRVHRPRERARQSGLPHARVVLDQDVALGEQRHEHVADHALRRLDRLGDVVPEPRAELCYLGRIELRDGRHAPPW